MAEKRNAPAVLVDQIAAEGLAPGSIKFYAREGKPHGINFVCPCGCGAVGGVVFDPGRWTWNGNRERPTVTPSILQMRCGWHGYLTDGEFREC